MEKQLRIDGNVIAVDQFVWDECHKFYLITNDEGRKQLLECGWSTADFLPVSELSAAWEDSCGLRFINSADLETRFVEQFQDATVTYS